MQRNMRVLFLHYFFWSLFAGNIFYAYGFNNQQNPSICNTKRNAKSNQEEEEKPIKVVVIGGGWAGFTAADALSTIKRPTTVSTTQAFDIEILDASPRGPGGLASGWKTSQLKRPVEAGIHGFWREYKNTFATMKNRIGLNLNDVLTPYTPSILISKSGRVALSPVLGEDHDQKDTEVQNPASLSRNFNAMDADSVIAQLAELLPPPIDLALLSEIQSDNPLTTFDRLSGIGLLGAWADFEQEDSESWDRYDKISADNLFRSIAGVTPTLCQELISPLLHVLPMTPAYDCSAAAALSCFHVFALQSKGAFDVRWARGTITDKIFNPWTKVLQSRGNVNFRGAARVSAIAELEPPQKHQQGQNSIKKFLKTRFRIAVNDGADIIDCDAIVLAIGGTSLKKLVPSCSPLSKLPISKRWDRFRGVTCVAVRIFFDSTEMISSVATAMKDSPVVVCGANVGSIPELTETGFCIYDLERLQDSTDVAATLEVDFFRADSLADLSDCEVLSITLKAIAAALHIPLIDEKLIAESSVVRARDAVSHFCVDSASWSPVVKLAEGLYVSGDWVDRKGHASWSIEKSVVTGIQAAQALANDAGMSCDVAVIPAAPDTPHLAALRNLARITRGLLPTGLDLKPQAPWVVANRILGGN